MAEHRFFQTFLTVGASMMLVGGGLVLLTSTSPFTSPPAVIEASTPDSARVVATAPDQTRLSQPVEATPDLNDAAAALKEPDTAQPEAALAPDIPSPDDDAVAARHSRLSPTRPIRRTPPKEWPWSSTWPSLTAPPIMTRQ